MNIAVVGFDSATLPLAAAASERGHRLVAAFDMPREGLESLRRVAPNVLAGANDELLSDRWDAVIVGRFASEDRGLAQLKLLFQAELPLVVSHPVIDSMLAAHELDMTRQAGGAVVVPYVPEVYLQAIENLARLAWPGSASELGTIERVSVTRAVAETSTERVLAALAHDVAWLQFVAGRVTAVVAMASAPDRLGDVQVQMSTQRGVVVRWNVASGGASSVTASGDRARLLMTLPDDGANVVTERQEGGDTTRIEHPPVDTAQAAWDELDAAIAGTPPVIGWLDVAHSLEITDAARRSLARGRAVDLYLEEQTEQGTFKGIMAAGGCLVLLASLVIVIAGTTAAKFNVPRADLWPFALLALLGGFLALQLLRIVFPRDGH
jgi:hypothetical protein